MTQRWSNNESRQMHNQPRHQTWYNNSIFDQFRVPNTHWLVAAIPWSFDLMEKLMKYFYTQMETKISHVENYSIYVGYSIKVMAGRREIWFSLVGRSFIFFVHRSARGRKISQFWRLRAAPSTIDPLIWIAGSQSIFGLWWPSLVTTSLK